MKTIKAALLNSNKDVIGEVFNAPKSGFSIEIANSFTIDGTPVNVETYKISRSKSNLLKAQYTQPISKVNSRHGDVYTFMAIDDEFEVVY